MYPYVSSRQHNHRKLYHLSFVVGCGGSLAGSLFINNSATCLSDVTGVCSAQGGAVYGTEDLLWTILDSTFDGSKLSGNGNTILKGAAIMMLYSVINIVGGVVKNSRAQSAHVVSMDGAVHIYKPSSGFDQCILCCYTLAIDYLDVM